MLKLTEELFRGDKSYLGNKSLRGPSQQAADAKILKVFGIDAIYIKDTTQKLSDRLAYIMEEDK